MHIDHTLAHKEHINRYKMAHIISVAERMREKADDFGLDGDEMYVLGFLHDIGYLHGRAGHEEYGADLLLKFGLGSYYDLIIREHGKDLETVRDEVLEAAPFALLIRTDYEIGTKGYPVSRADRIDEIKSRFPGDEAVATTLHHADLYLTCVEGHEKDLKTAVSMFRDRLREEREAKDAAAKKEAEEKAAKEAAAKEAAAKEAEAKAKEAEAAAAAATAAEVKDDKPAKKTSGRKKKAATVETDSKIDSVIDFYRNDMITLREAVTKLRDLWKDVVTAYKDTREENRPDTTTDAILAKMTLSDAITVFSLVAKIKEHDGRIYGTNRDFMNERFSAFSDNNYDVARLATDWTRDNPFIHAGLDDIHTAHIDNLITELRKREREQNKPNDKGKKKDGEHNDI